MKRNIYEVFDDLPNDALLDIKEVCEMFCCSQPTIWRNVKSNKFPKPIKPTLRTTRWRVIDLRIALKGDF